MSVEDRAIVVLTANTPVPTSFQEKGSNAGLRWGSSTLGDLTHLESKQPDAALAFLSEQQYQEAIQALTVPQTAEVMELRIKQPGNYLWDMAEQLGRELAFLGSLANKIGRETQDPVKSERWQSLSGLLLDTDQKCYLTGRVVEWHRDSVSAAIQWRTYLRSLEEDLSRASGSSAELSEAAAKASAAYNNSYHHLAEAARVLGEPAFLQAPARDTEQRVVFAAEDDLILGPMIEHQEVLATKWNGGWLVALNPDQMQRYALDGPFPLLYLSIEEDSRAMSLLTPAQLEHDRQVRFERRTPGYAQYTERILTRRRMLVAHLGGLIEAGTKLGPANQSAIDQLRLARASEIETLSAIFAASQAKPGDFQKAVERIAMQVRVFQEFVVARQEKELLSWAEGFLAIMPKIEDMLRGL